MQVASFVSTNGIRYTKIRRNRVDMKNRFGGICFSMKKRVGIKMQKEIRLKGNDFLYYK
jgi:hypothetical protein